MLCWIQRGPNHIKTEHLQQISMRNIALSPGKCWRSQRGQSSSVHQMAHPFNSEAACAWHASPYQARLRVSWEVCLISSCHLFSSSAIHLGASTNTAKKKKQNIFANDAKQARSERLCCHFFVHLQQLWELPVPLALGMGIKLII